MMEAWINLIFVVVLFVFLVKILRKAGHSGWHSLWIVVPLVNLFMFWFFAFKKWPVERELEAKKQAEEDVFVEKP
ncbi:MAG: hypothetical protein RI556_12670 [Hydrogenovibrio sp.]|uniref:hypothetical protein n=1 Tax=Hydrogenovibrio sp. TaxID=2065821 RepID=UPI0028702D9F|nr:hypothetical protein [Hydrogenovibrio sp.]MDR9500023.1 hypothetical protein [Hydrogenovibrio sp.]